DTAAGGGYGSPLERALEDVQADVRDGLVSREQAEMVYGVILEPGTAKLDRRASEEKRRQLANFG
ncbi:MAG: hydantoinase B/oxoprolinase family protein, partial [Chloroflexi bacterium]|nr:hydantoinase B/oxoprolinase family protein [Chloroflexota bacterium]